MPDHIQPRIFLFLAPKNLVFFSNLSSIVSLVKDQSDMPPGEKSIMIDASSILLSLSLIDTTDTSPFSNKFVRLTSATSVTDKPTVRVVELVGLSLFDVEIPKPLTPPKS